MGKFVALLAGSNAPIPPDAVMNYIDVRDFAEAVYQSISRGVEGRYGVRAGGYDHQLIADRMRELLPEQEALGRIPIGEKGVYQSVIGPRVTMDVSKAAQNLGMKCEWRLWNSFLV